MSRGGKRRDGMRRIGDEGRWLSGGGGNASEARSVQTDQTRRRESEKESPPVMISGLCSSS